MKKFFDGRDDSSPARAAAPHSLEPGTVTLLGGPAGARIAVYDGLSASPRVEDVLAEGLAEAIEQLASRTYNIARERGGSIPYTIIREVSENLIHAGFSEVVVTVLDDGDTVRFSDQGPGIPDKEKALLPGFSTATTPMKRIIRGVGSGLPIVKETLSFAGGTIEIDDNLGRGTVVTLKAGPRSAVRAGAPTPSRAVPRLSDRQKRVISIILEMGAVGPTVVSQQLGVGVATAYRDLAFLEEAGLISADDTGKRTLTEFGVASLEQVFA
jgi:anti-sigma regulatory factor (Ser/Thr protein kinase)